MSRGERKQVAEETVSIIGRGGYTAPDGADIDLADAIANTREHTELIRPDEFEPIFRAASTAPDQPSMTIDVFNETTFTGAKALLDAGAPTVCSLNFASAKNPGGGWLSGSQAQEEALARASGLHVSLETQMEYYEFHRNGGNALYSHHMIYSPDVVVFRDDAEELISEPWSTSIITSPAANAGALAKNAPELVPQVETVMRERIDRVLAVAASHGHQHLVLGAWGCGVFGNDPTDVARWFGDQLAHGAAGGTFASVRFSVLDLSPSTATYSAFFEHFA